MLLDEQQNETMQIRYNNRNINILHKWDKVYVKYNTALHVLRINVRSGTHICNHALQ